MDARRRDRSRAGSDLSVHLRLERSRMTPPEVTELSKGPAVGRLERDRLKVMRVDVGLERRTLEQQMAERDCDRAHRVQSVRRPVERTEEERHGSPGFDTRIASCRTASVSVTCSNALNEQTGSNSAPKRHLRAGARAGGIRCLTASLMTSRTAGRSVVATIGATLSRARRSNTRARSPSPARNGTRNQPSRVCCTCQPKRST